MRVFITGATGFLGSALTARLVADGHRVVAWVRSIERARARLGADVDLVQVSAGFDALIAGVSGADAVVNLAGEPLIGRRWTVERRLVLEASRVQVTDDLVRAVAAASARPRVLVSGSGCVCYGDRVDERLTEQSSRGDDFLGRLCRDWERAAMAADALGLRVVLSRTAVVLGRGGGALAQMLPPFKLGLGGPIGSGRQYMPWIHLSDFTAFLAGALTDPAYRRPIHRVAPPGAARPCVGRGAGPRRAPARRAAGAGLRAAGDLRRSGDGSAGQSARRTARAARSRVHLLVSRPRRCAGVYNSSLTFRDLPLAARIHLLAVMCAGAAACAVSVRAGALDRPWILLILALASIAPHTIKIDLPLTSSVSTISTGYAVGFASLLLFGLGPTVLMMVPGAWAQCTIKTKTKNPWYRTAFSISTLTVSMFAA